MELIYFKALWQLRFLACITPLRKILVKARSAESVSRFAENLKSSKFASDREWEVEVEQNSEKLMTQCQLVHTVTYAREPVLLKKPREKRFLHITCVGADTVGKQELLWIQIFDTNITDISTHPLRRHPCVTFGCR